MAALALERTFRPPKTPSPEFAASVRRLLDKRSATLVGPEGERVVLPAEVFDVLRDVVDVMSQGQAVVVAPVHQRLTTQEAADLLGMSRPTFVKLLDAGQIPYDRPRRHRRVRLDDLLAYTERRSAESRAALDRMVEIAQEAGMYERTAAPESTR
ncbi:MAG: helix-turn-helix domain-containing protein [Acidimicrobiaceae bacterium]|nr:helix-turn-helix domain-containing protein [Acidimicrobiaceae bacterium]